MAPTFSSSSFVGPSFPCILEHLSKSPLLPTILKVRWNNGFNEFFLTDSFVIYRGNKKFTCKCDPNHCSFASLISPKSCICLIEKTYQILIRWCLATNPNTSAKAFKTLSETSDITPLWRCDQGPSILFELHCLNRFFDFLEKNYKTLHPNSNLL